MPASYGLAKRKGEASERLPWRQVREWLRGSRNYWLATTRPDGRPHAVPVWALWLDETLYFATDRQSQKARNLAASPELVVHLESGDEVAILEGRAEEVTDPALLAKLADAWEAKYEWRPNADDPAMVHYAVRPRVAFSWLEGDALFPETATRWRFPPG
jgi:PPOX class probable F420-dependent enzyme